MALNTNIGNWFSGGTRERERQETREAWARTEALWRASPLADDNAVYDMVVATLREATAKAGETPATPLYVELAMLTDFLLKLEEIRDLEVTWPIIENDASAAVGFRQLMRRREKWVREFDRHKGIVTREFGAAYAELIKRMPPSCFRNLKTEDGLFEVPLIELLEEPAKVVQALLWAPYAPEALELDMFRQLRQEFEVSVRLASGLSPTDNSPDHQHRIVQPVDHKNKNAAELVQLYLGRTPFAAYLETPVPFEVPQESRFEHCHIVGGTGHGKTQLMQRMIHSDLLAAQKDGRSVIVIDSQGDLISKLVRLDLFQPGGALAERLVIIDPADVEFPAALNLFDPHLDRVTDYRPVDRERVLNGVVELYETFFGALLGAELTQKQGVIFKYLARLMLTIPDATIHTLMQLMEDGKPFKPFMEKLDGSARYFFQTEFFQPGFVATKKQILRRLWGVLSTPAFERMFAQKQNKLDLFQAMQDGKIILINTAKDLLKQEGSQLFGRFFIAMLAQAALERSTVAQGDRTPTFVYVDEAQEYFDDTVETILNQARKYRVGLTVAHQTLDQLTPRLRAVLHANTAMKCAGGVSARDARAFADELHTTPDFIESMRRGDGKTEFAVWIRQQTPRAIRLSVPLGHLERQATLDDEDFDDLLAANRLRYCGTLADVQVLQVPVSVERSPPEGPPVAKGPAPQPAQQEPEEPWVAPPVSPPIAPEPRPPRGSGKGGPKHRYLQELVKGLGEQQGFKSTIEAPLAGGGQVDILLERDGLAIPIEVSVTTPADWELGNIRKCLAAGYPVVGVVLAKSKRVELRYREALLQGLDSEARSRVVLLAPEGVPDFIAGLAPAPEPQETLVKGYRVRVSRTDVSAEEAQARRASLARLVAKSLDRNEP